MSIRQLGSLCVLMLATACSKTGVVESQPTAIPVHAVDKAAMDPAVKAGDDFDAFANGKWMASAVIPPERASTGSYLKVQEEVEKRVRAILEEAMASNAAPGTEQRKIADFVATYLDEAALEQKGLTPLKPTLDRIAALKTSKDLARELGSRLRADVDAFNATDFYTDNVLGLWVEQDLDAPPTAIPYLMQGGLGMPDRSYYVDASPKLVEVRGKYLTHLEKLFTLAGYSEPAARAKRVMALETAIAKTHGTRTDSVDVQKSNNKWKRGEFSKRAPGMDWDAFLTAAKLDQQPVFTVWHPTAVVGLGKLVKSEPLATWKDYLTLRSIEHVAQLLPKAYGEEMFAFYGTTLTGAEKQLDRWKRAIYATDNVLGEPVGKIYVGRYFPPEAKAEIEQMVQNLIVAFSKRIDSLAWMSPETKVKAKEKLAVLKVSVAYPNKWRDFSGLEIVRGDAIGNLERSERFEYDNALASLGKPIDRDAWVMLPHEVNAVNLPARNALNFPAGYLEPPLYDRHASAAVKYGTIGVVIGHEISHSFDDQGAMFDATGKLASWWTPADLKHFTEAGQVLVKQYDAYKPFPDLSLNGALTLSENIADLGGLAVALDGWRTSLNGAPAPVVDGYTGEQQFFLGHAQAGQVMTRPEALRRQILTDGHSPQHYRTLMVRNLDDWYAAFEVKQGEALYLSEAERARIW